MKSNDTRDRLKGVLGESVDRASGMERVNFANALRRRHKRLQATKQESQ